MLEKEFLWQHDEGSITSSVVPTSWVLLQGFLRRRINIKYIQFMSSRGCLIFALGLKEIQNRNESQRCNYFHTASAAFIHISWQLHGRGDHHFYWNGTATSQGFTIHVKHCVLSRNAACGFYCLYLTTGVRRKEQQGVISCVFTKLTTLVSTGLF